MSLDMNHSCERFAADFWRQVDRSGGPDACWPWTGALNTGGYGMFRHTRAHRVALNIGKGPYDDALSALHSCDNRPCCNPSHLRSGTQRENMADMKSRKRSVPCIRKRFGDYDVLIVHTLLRLGWSFGRIAKARKTSFTTIASIKRAERWSWLKDLSRPCISKEAYEGVLALRGSGAKQIEVAQRYGVSRGVVRFIWNGRTGKRWQEGASE